MVGMIRRRRLDDFVTHHGEPVKPGSAERRRKGDIGGIPSRCHQYPANTRRVIAGIEGPPTVAQVDFKPCAEIHGQHQRDANVAEIPRGISGGNMHRAAKRDRKMLEIPANSLAFA